MKEVPIIWSEESLIDLDVIQDFLSEESLPAANKVVEGIIERVSQLKQYPESGQRQEGLRSKKYRYLVEGNYKVIYSYKQGEVYIHSILDTRQDPKKMKGSKRK